MNESMQKKKDFLRFSLRFSNTEPGNYTGFSEYPEMLIMNLNDAFLNSFQERNARLAFLENQRSSFGNSIADRDRA